MDHYPVKARTAGHVARNLRLRSDAHGAVVWQFNRETGDVEEFIRTDQPATRVGATQNWKVGDFVFEPQRGCGCNHPMYSWSPPEN